jgi:hypothetical protein
VSRFPAEAYGEAAAMFDASLKGAQGASRDRRLRVRGFLLWWNARPVAGNPRELVLKMAESMFGAIDRIRAEDRTLVIDDSQADDPEEGGDDVAFDIADAYVENHSHEQIRGSALRRGLRNLGRQRADFLSVVKALLTTALGGLPALDGATVEGEPSLASLILKSFAADDFPKVQQVADVANLAAPHEMAGDEHQLRDILEWANVLADRGKVSGFVASLSDEELIAARKYARVFLEDIPTIFEAHEILFGRNKFSATLRVFSRASVGQIAYLVIGVAWFVRKFGAARFESISENCERARSQAQALCALTKAFPKYRELFLARNIDRLAALSEIRRQEMWESIKTIVAQ